MTERGGRRARVLAAEDDPDVHFLLELLLASAGYDVVVEADGASALTALRETGPFDLLMLDVAMPGELDGLEVTREVRADPTFVGLPILLLSARTQEQHIEEGLAAGADAYVIKPFDTDVLLARIESLLGTG